MKIMSSMPNFPVSSLFEDLLLFASCYTTLTVMTSRTVLDIVKKEGGKYDFANQYSLIVKILIKKYKKYYKNYEKIKKIMKNIILCILINKNSFKFFNYVLSTDLYLKNNNNLRMKYNTSNFNFYYNFSFYGFSFSTVCSDR